MNLKQEQAQARALEETRRFMNSAAGKASLERARRANYERLKAENARLDAQREEARQRALRDAPLDAALLAECEQQVVDLIVRGARIPFADGQVATPGRELNWRTREELTRRTKIALSLKGKTCEVCALQTTPQTCTELCPDFVAERCTRGRLCHKLHGCERLAPPPRTRGYSAVPSFLGPAATATARAPAPFRPKWRE